MEKKTLGELGEAISTSGFLLGIPSGLDIAEDFVRSKAGRIFAEGGSVETAVMLRNLADELGKLSKKRYSQYETKGRPAADAAFAELDRRDQNE